MKLAQRVPFPSAGPGEEFAVELPAYSDIVEVGVEIRPGGIELPGGGQSQTQFHFFGMVLGDPSERTVHRRFCIVELNQAVPDSATYLGSVLLPDGRFTFVFEINAAIPPGLVAEAHETLCGG